MSGVHTDLCAIAEHLTSRLRAPRTPPSQFVFSYTCHQNIISITNELIEPTPRRTSRLISISMALSMALYFCIAIGGYATFGPRVHPDILATYPASRIVAIARLCISVVVTFSYPLQSHPSRASLISLMQVRGPPPKSPLLLLRHRRSRRVPPASPIQAVVSSVERRRSGARASDGDGEAAGSAAKPPMSWSLRHAFKLHVAVTAAFLLASTGIALAVDDLGIVLSMVGATGSSIVSFVLPGGCSYLLFRRRGRVRWLGLGLLVVGATLIPMSLALIVTRRGAAAGGGGGGGH